VATDQNYNTKNNLDTSLQKRQLANPGDKPADDPDDSQNGNILYDDNTGCHKCDLLSADVVIKVVGCQLVL
jgi:hypothetical protein